MPQIDLSKPNTTKRERVSFASPFAGDDCEYAAGGKFGGGQIKNASLITRGEALGHGMWIDNVMLHQVADALNASEDGIKSRFTHPGMSSDGMGKATGKYFNARVDGDQVKVDHHFYKSAKESPGHGDLPSYLMNLSKEDPKAFGLSIVFNRDKEGMSKFSDENKSEDGSFKSPDELNEKHLPHVRLGKLFAGDFVDDPAANPNGLFHNNEELFSILEESQGSLEFVLGLSDEKPSDVFGVEADRAKAFVERILLSKGFTLAKKTDPVKEDNVDLTQRLRELTEKYGATVATDAVLNGKSEHQIVADLYSSLQTTHKDLQQQFEELKRFSAGGETEPLSQGKEKPEEKKVSHTGLSPGVQRYVDATKN
jgi:hypothetical protein